MRRAFMIHGAAALLPSLAAAQLCHSSAGVSVRKTFDGSKLEKSPAAFFWANAPTAKDKRYSLVDAGVKVVDLECDPGSSQLLMYPALEYHSTNAASKPADNGNISANAEFRPFPITILAPTLLGSVKATRDFKKSVNGDKLAADLTLTSNVAGLPGSDIRFWSSGFLRYYPYAGVERYHAGPVGADTTGTFGLLRLWTEFSPIARGTVEVLQLTTDWSGRKRLSGRASPGIYAHDVALGANLYLDGDGHIGIGVEYARGEDAENGFAFREKTSIGLKVKY